MDKAKKILRDVVEVGILVAALGVLAQVLFSGDLPFVGNVSDNLTAMIGSLGENGLGGLISLVVILWVFQKRS